MIQIEETVMRGRVFLHTWSDTGHMLLRDGVEYEEAYDPLDSGRVYGESPRLIGESEEPI